ncbi:sulfotransferase family protein [Gracilibacillus sp. D59]|uniref:sulfotransferase family protein n=1 Tax=Gracilibacillus sp. D59 TaxID=3457434 RepID=UPI003FCCB041
MEEPIFILGCHKSGTSLMRNLLDGHCKLFVVPIESHFFQLSRIAVDYRLRQTEPANFDLEEIKTELFNWIKRNNKDHSDVYADSNTSGKWDLQKFSKYIINSDINNWNDLFIAYIKGMYYSLFSKEVPPGTRFVEKSVENAEFAWILKGIFPKAKFIHVVRNPYATLTAIRKHKTYQGAFPFLGHSLFSMRNSYYNLYKNNQFLPDYHVVKYENLVLETEKVMKELSINLNIEFNDNLLIPTTLNQIWKGNSTTNKSFLKVSSIPTTHWRDDIRDIEVNLVNRAFPFLLRDFGYEILNTKANIKKKEPDEDDQIYIRNRILFDLI